MEQNHKIYSIEDLGIVHEINGVLYKLRIDPKTKTWVNVGLATYLENYSYWNNSIGKTDKWGENGELLREKYKHLLENYRVPAPSTKREICKVNKEEKK